MTTLKLKLNKTQGIINNTSIFFKLYYKTNLQNKGDYEFYSWN